MFLQELWSAESEDEGEEERASDSNQTLLVWRPGATARRPLPVTVKNDTTHSWGLWGPEAVATGPDIHTQRHQWMDSYTFRLYKDWITLRHLKMPQYKQRSRRGKDPNEKTATRMFTLTRSRIYFLCDYHCLYKRPRRANSQFFQLYEEVRMLDDGLHSNTESLSTEKLGGQIATINHLLSADLQATRGSV